MSDEVSRFYQQSITAPAEIIMFNPKVLSQNGLACPYAKFNRGAYRNPNCRPDKGWLRMGKLSEHIRRCHAPQQNCPSCNKRWAAKPRKDAAFLSERAAHQSDCCGYGRSDGLEIMDFEQQTAFDEIGRTKDNGTKLIKIYRLLGKPIEHIDLFFHVRDARPLAASSSSSNSNSNSGLFSNGFTYVDSSAVAPAPRPRRIKPLLQKQQKTMASEDGRPSGGKYDSAIGSETMKESSEFSGSGETVKGVDRDQQSDLRGLLPERSSHSVSYGDGQSLYPLEIGADEDLLGSEEPAAMHCPNCSFVMVHGWCPNECAVWNLRLWQE